MIRPPFRTSIFEVLRGEGSLWARRSYKEPNVCDEENMRRVRSDSYEKDLFTYVFCNGGQWRRIEEFANQESPVEDFPATSRYRINEGLFRQ